MSHMSEYLSLIQKVFQIRPGIATLADDSEGLRNHIVMLIREAKSHVDEDKQSSTLLAFMATAGKGSQISLKADKRNINTNIKYFQKNSANKLLLCEFKLQSVHTFVYNCPVQ